MAGHVSGYGLSTEAPVGENPSSTFGVRADKFFLAGASYSGESAPTTNLYKGRAWYKPSTQTTYYYTGSTWSTDPAYAVIPFQVLTVPTTINGVTIQPGVYIDGATIRNASIDWATIRVATIDWLTVVQQLKANSILAGTVLVSDTISSANYAAGSSGWTIKGNGNAEFNNVVIRNNVSAGNSIYGGAATGFASGTGFFAGWDSTTYKWRVGLAAAQRVAWDGAALSVFDHGNKELLKFSGSESFIKLGSATYDPNRFVLSGTQQRLTVNDGTRDRVVLGRLGSGTTNYGIEIWDSDGNLILSSGRSLARNLGFPITADNISTYIASAAIGNAYIGNAAIKTANIADAQLTTLKIGANAVTIPQVISGTSGTITVNAPVTMPFIIIMSLDASGTNHATMRLTVSGQTATSVELSTALINLYSAGPGDLGGLNYDYYIGATKVFKLTLNAGSNTLTLAKTGVFQTSTTVAIIGAAR